MKCLYYLIAMGRSLLIPEVDLGHIVATIVLNLSFYILEKGNIRLVCQIGTDKLNEVRPQLPNE